MRKFAVHLVVVLFYDRSVDFLLSACWSFLTSCADASTMEAFSFSFRSAVFRGNSKVSLLLARPTRVSCPGRGRAWVPRPSPTGWDAISILVKSRRSSSEPASAVESKTNCCIVLDQGCRATARAATTSLWGACGVLTAKARDVLEICPLESKSTSVRRDLRVSC